jgi:cysteine synthase A
MIYNSILETIGQTPVVRLNRLAPEHVELFVKIEFFNPMASVKDRLAIGIIEDAERRGELKPGQTVVEATSGNTGIAMAMVCAAKGHPFVSFMVETFSIERRKLMRALGAKVILTPKEEKGTGMVRAAAEAARRNGWFLARQFENEANPAYHRNTTGPEILRDFAGRDLDYFVTGWGTGGTMTGAGEMLKLARPDIQVIATEPQTAQLMAGKAWEPHKIQGWTPDFIPKIMNTKIADEIVPVTDDESRDVARDLAAKEGIMTGVSGGGTVAAALKVAAKAPQGSTLLAMIPDTGERYISTYLFDGVNEGSDEDWLKENGYAD